MEMKPKRRMNETQIEKKEQREANRINQFQQRKRAGELTIGMGLCNATLERLGHKIKEEDLKEIATVSAEAAGEKAATLAAKCAEQKLQYPSHTLCYSVSLALQAPLAVKMEKQENRYIRNPDAAEVKQLCSVIRKERAEELARAGMGNNAARKRSTMAVLKSDPKISKTVVKK